MICTTSCWLVPHPKKGHTTRLSYAVSVLNSLLQKTTASSTNYHPIETGSILNIDTTSPSTWKLLFLNWSLSCRLHKFAFFVSPSLFFFFFPPLRGRKTLCNFSDCNRHLWLSIYFHRRMSQIFC